MNSKSTHILSTSVNLLGFCLIVITSLKISNYSEKSLIDEFTGFASVLLSASSFLSFLSIRSNSELKSIRYENVADIIFLIALTLIFIVIVLVSLNIMF